MITAWDPGKTTGWAAWKDDGTFLEMGQCDLEEIVGTWKILTLNYGRIKRVVMEDFRLFKKRALQQSGSDMPASQGIGMLKALAANDGSEIIMQPSNIKPIAQKMSQVAIPKNHDDSHQVDAYLHGYYKLVQDGLVKTPLQLKKERENNG